MGITLGLRPLGCGELLADVGYTQAIDAQLITAPDALKRAGEQDVRLLIERKEIDHAHSRKETEGNSSHYVCQDYDVRSRTLWARP